MTMVTAFLPASQELRYYLYWMLCLIIINLFLIVHGLHGPERLNARALFLGGALACLLFVLCSNGGEYIRTSGAVAEDLSRGLGISSRLSSLDLRSGEAVCVLGKNPLTFLYAPTFNKDLDRRVHYRVLEGYSPSDCMGIRTVP
jgi:hypothetical protein